jgi:hypothetical protein
MHAARLFCLLALVVVVASCGSEDEGTDRVTGAGPPAETEAGGNRDGADEPGAPGPGEPVYAGLGSWWVKLGTDARLASAAEFIEDNPGQCGGVAVEDLERQSRIALGLDFPVTTPVSEVMLETCALIRDGA